MSLAKNMMLVLAVLIAGVLITKGYGSVINAPLHSVIAMTGRIIR